MRRRDFIALMAVGAGVCPLARAQEPMRRIAVLMPYADDVTVEARLSLFRQGLKLRGWTDGRNVRIDYYFANSDRKQMRSCAAKAVATAPDVIFAASPPMLAALKQETDSIPVVFTNVTDPVGIELVQSLSHPGGNMTGFGAYEFSIAGKWVELLKQVAPSLVRIAVVKMPQHATNAKLFQAAQAFARSLNIELAEADVRNQAEIAAAAATIAQRPNSGLLVLPSPATTDFHEVIVQLAARYGLPAIYPYRELAGAGGLMSYGPNIPEDYKGAALYVDRILKGEKPADLPVQAPAKFDLMINMRTAKALGLIIPPSLLATADEVIE